jgi:uncharacterized protein YbjT (DUF2867 family)
LKVAVVGGTGALGRLVVEELAERGDEITILSRSAGTALPDGVAHRRVDLANGEGLAAGLAGVEAAGGPGFEEWLAQDMEASR